MIKKSDNGFKELASIINKAIESDSKTIVVDISKGLWGIGSIAVKNSICNEMGIDKPWRAPFSCDISTNDDEYKLTIKIKKD